MEENFCMEWNMERKIFSVEWKKIASMEYGKIVFHFIPYHALLPRLFSIHVLTRYSMESSLSAFFYNVVDIMLF